MSELSTFLTEAFDEALPVMGDSCTINGVSATGVWSEIDVQSEQTDTAYQPSASATVSLSKTDFTTTPTIRTTVARNNTNYSVVSVRENDSGWVLVLIKQV